MWPRPAKVHREAHNKFPYSSPSNERFRSDQAASQENKTQNLPTTLPTTNLLPKNIRFKVDRASQQTRCVLEIKPRWVANCRLQKFTDVTHVPHGGVDGVLAFSRQASCVRRSPSAANSQSCERTNTPQDATTMACMPGVQTRTPWYLDVVARCRLVSHLTPDKDMLSMPKLLGPSRINVPQPPPCHVDPPFTGRHQEAESNIAHHQPVRSLPRYRRRQS